MTAHRPFPMPERPWKYYQEWHDVLFGHWRVPVETLQELIPQGIELDLYEGEAWVSMVAFEVRKLRPHFFPPFPPISDFIEINMRTYVKRNEKPGIYFFSLEAQKAASACLGRVATGLPYMKTKATHPQGIYDSFNAKQGFHMQVKYTPGESVQNKTELDKWLTERYCLFLERNGKIVGNDVHHFEWPLQSVEVEQLKLHYQYKNLIIDNKAERYHYSKGVFVPTWGQVKQ